MEKVLDELYRRIKKYINTSDFDELKEHYDWYKVQYGDKEDLINRMYESYVNSYSDEELMQRITDFDE